MIRNLRRTTPHLCCPECASQNCHTHARNWIIPDEVQVVIEKAYKYELLAPKFLALSEKGVSTSSIAAAHGMAWAEADAILEFARTGERPDWNARKRENRRTRRTASGPSDCDNGGGASGNVKRQSNKYIPLAPEVARLRDEEKMSFARIADILKVGRNTVIRAYDYAHADSVQRVVEKGESPTRGRYSHLGEDKYHEIRQRLRRGEAVANIARAVGCGTSTVNRERQRLK